MYNEVRMHDIATFMSAGGDNYVSFEIINAKFQNVLQQITK